MNRTARFVLKLGAAGLALAALVCLVVGSWSDVAEKCCSGKRLAKRGSEYDDYDDEELYEE